MGSTRAQPLVVGLSHQRATLAELGRASVCREALPEALAGLRSAGFTEVVVLSTCSRTEIYTTACDDAAPRVARALTAIAGWSGLSLDRLEGVADVLCGGEAVTHLFRVTAGLESRLVGDVDVLAQVRHAWRAAGEAGAAGPLLGRVFPASIRCAKQVHAETELGRQGRSLARRAVDVGLAAAHGTPELDVLVVGSGRMARVACEHLSAAGQPFRVTARDEVFAARLAGADRACSLGQLVDHVRRADLLLCATSAAHHVLRLEHVSQAMAGRDRPLTIVDLAVPRNVDVGVGEVAGVRLVDMTALGDDASREPGVAAAVADATRAVEAAARRLCDDLAATRAGPVIEAVRARVEATCSEELRRHGGAADPEELARAVHALVGKIMHRPAVLARAAAAAGDRRALLLLCEAFGVAADAVPPSWPPPVVGGQTLGYDG